MIIRKPKKRRIMGKWIIAFWLLSAVGVLLLMPAEASVAKYQQNQQIAAIDRTGTATETDSSLDVAKIELGNPIGVLTVPSISLELPVSKALKEEAKSLYGESKRETKDAEKNALFDLKKRTGNAILTELKRQDSQIKPLIESVNQLQAISKERSFQPLKQLPTNEYKYSYEEFMKRRKQFQQRVVTQRILRQLNRTINAHEEKYRASKAYEEQQRRIQMEQERQ